MEQKIRASEGSFEGIGGECERREALSPREQAGQGSPLLEGVLRLVWLGLKLLNTIFHRWFNLCEVGMEEVFYALMVPRFFAELETVPVAARQQSAALYSHHLMEENDFVRPADSQDRSGYRPEPTISWRTPWLYLVLILLVWLLLF
jgi:hypothetical protein